MTTPQHDLGALLRVRRRTELRHAVVVADAERERLATEQSIHATSERIEAARHALRGALDGTLDAALLRLTAQGALIEERERRRAMQRLAALGPTLDRARSVLADASAQRKAVELLRERRRVEILRRAERREQAALDEIAARCDGGFA